MEIKVLCACGQKYAFTAVPVQGRMPFTVTCPACGEDGTQLANEFIRQQTSTQAPPVGVLLSEAPVAAAPPPPPPAAPVPGGLRINRPAQADIPPPPPAALPPPPRPVPQHAAMSAKPQKSKRLVPTILIIVFILAILGFGAWKVGRKVYRFVNSMKEVANAINEASNANYNFNHDDAVVLYIQHTNHVTVADACKDYWRDNLKKNLTAVPVKDDEGIGSNEYGVYESYNGWVRLMSAPQWRPEEFEGLSKHLSEHFGTLVFETSESDFSGAYHFGVYEAGARKFHAKMEVKIKKDDYDEIVTTEGDDWAIAHGFKPGSEGFKEFSMFDADKITQDLGMKIWDEPEDRKAKMILLKEAAK